MICVILPKSVLRVIKSVRIRNGETRERLRVDSHPDTIDIKGMNEERLVRNSRSRTFGTRDVWA